MEISIYRLVNLVPVIRRIMRNRADVDMWTNKMFGVSAQFSYNRTVPEFYEGVLK